MQPIMCSRKTEMRLFRTYLINTPCLTVNCVMYILYTVKPLYRAESLGTKHFFRCKEFAVFEKKTNFQERKYARVKKKLYFG